MTVTMNTADKVLKTAYLDVVSEYLDYNANAFLSKIKKTTDNVWGKEIKKLVKAGINGGISAGSEDGELPESYANMYNEFVIGLKNLYGTIELSDKAREQFIEEGFDLNYGARPLKRLVSRTLETDLAKMIITGNIKYKDTVVVDFKENFFITRKNEI